MVRLHTGYIYSTMRTNRNAQGTPLTFKSRADRIMTASVAEWLRAWDTLTMFEATMCGNIVG